MLLQKSLSASKQQQKSTERYTVLLSLRFRFSVITEDSGVPRVVHCFDDPDERRAASNFDDGVRHSVNAVQSVAKKVR